MNETIDHYVVKNRGKITFHKFQSFVDCPMAFRLRYVDEILPPLESDALTFGTAFDEYLHDEKKTWKKYRIVAKRGVFVPSTLKKIETLQNKIFDEIEKEEEFNRTIALNTHTPIKDPEKPTKDEKELLKGAEKAEKGKEKSIEKMRGFDEDIQLLREELEKVEGIEELTEAMGELLIKGKQELERQPLYQRFPKKLLQWEYKGHKFSAELDGLSLKEGLIVDDKTSGSIDLLERWLPKYKRQLAWYQWGLEMVEKKTLPAQLNVVTKESPCRSAFYFASVESLQMEREQIMLELDMMFATMKRGIYPMPTREEWLKSDGYGFTDYDLQDELIEF